ncbi:MAG: Cof-type HAD-IIB family hydrolase [Lonepinella koalarum]|nr:Cof-type HAD-IIB family hydrolase [Lonepinella koalarum]
MSLNYRDQIKIVFFDIDETLLVKDKDYIPSSVIPALKALKANGITPAIATGRTNNTFPPKIKQLVEEVGIELFVTMNGQRVHYQGEVIAKYPIPKAKIAQIIRFLEAHHIEYGFVSESGIFVSNITEKVSGALDPLRTHYQQDKDYYLSHDVFQILPFYDVKQDKLVENSGILEGLQVIRWNENSVDLFDAQGSKARGIQDALNHFGLVMENAMAFGDGLNDIEMLKSVGVGVAMGNAHENVKKAATHVTDHIESHGIAHFLQKTGLI